MRTTRLGIDFNNTECRIVHENGLRLGSKLDGGERKTVVSFLGRYRRSGQAAHSNSLDFPEIAVKFLTAILGKTKKQTLERLAHLPIKMAPLEDNDSQGLMAKVKVDGKMILVSVEYVTAMFLSSLAVTVVKFLQPKEEAKFTIAVPSYYDEKAKSGLVNAAAIVGMPIYIITYEEALASCLFCELPLPRNKKSGVKKNKVKLRTVLLVHIEMLDMTVAVVKQTREDVKIVYSHCDGGFGHSDFDVAVYSDFAHCIGALSKIMPMMGRMNLNDEAVYNYCSYGKGEMMMEMFKEVMPPGFLDMGGTCEVPASTFTDERLVALCKTPIRMLKKKIKKILEDGNINTDTIDFIEATGPGTAAPYVLEAISSVVGKPIYRRLGDDAIAEGAAFYKVEKYLKEPSAEIMQSIILPTRVLEEKWKQRDIEGMKALELALEFDSFMEDAIERHDAHPLSEEMEIQYLKAVERIRVWLVQEQFQHHEYAKVKVIVDQFKYDISQFIPREDYILNGDASKGLHQADTKKAEGNEFFKNGDFLSALGKYNSAIKFADVVRMPSTSEHERQERLHLLYLNKALCLLNLKRSREAIEACNNAIHMDPLSVKSYYRRAMAHEHLGQYRKAKIDIARAVQIAPNDAAVLRLQHRIHSRME